MTELKLTVGMAVYKDFANLWSTVTALRMYHPEVLEQLDIVVVDNAPDTPDGERCKDFMENWVAKQPGLGQARYIPFGDFNSTAAPRNHVFACGRGSQRLGHGQPRHDRAGGRASSHRVV
jgi:hypothetical protein